jgi:superfamily I DNA/RNA helicase
MVVHGGKKKLQEGGLRGEITLMDLFHGKILTAEGVELVRGQNLRAFDHADDLEYYRRVVENGYSLNATEIPIITTIHGSKGRQSPKVVIFEEMGKKCKEDMDNEHRLAYVAATRTRGTLEVCAERKVDYYDERYD